MSHGTPLAFIHVWPRPSNNPTSTRVGRPAGIAPNAAAPAIESSNVSNDPDGSLGTPPQAPMTKQNPPHAISILFVYIRDPFAAERNERHHLRPPGDRADEAVSRPSAHTPRDLSLSSRYS